MHVEVVGVLYLVLLSPNREHRYEWVYGYVAIENKPLFLAQSNSGGISECLGEEKTEASYSTRYELSWIMAQCTGTMYRYNVYVHSFVAMVTHVRSCIWLGAEVVTFLPLQVALYFNVYYSPLWAIASILTLVNKVNELYFACVVCILIGLAAVRIIIMMS